jgi:hypothetical protein
LDINENVLNADLPTSNYGLQEHTDESDHPVFVNLSLSAASALIHAILQEDLDKLLREINLARESVENF